MRKAADGIINHEFHLCGRSVANAIISSVPPIASSHYYVPLTQHFSSPSPLLASPWLGGQRRFHRGGAGISTSRTARIRLPAAAPFPTRTPAPSLPRRPGVKAVRRSDPREEQIGRRGRENAYAK